MYYGCLRKKSLGFKEYALKHLGVKGHHVSNLLSNGSEKYIHLCMYSPVCVLWVHMCMCVKRENMIKQMALNINHAEAG